MSTADLFQLDAEEGSENEDDSFDEETGEVKERQRNGGDGEDADQIGDSSEEDDDDDDEDAEREVREGFIVDEDEEDAENEAKIRKREKKKRRREEREEEQGLDEEDLDLIGELQPTAPSEPKFKRLKRGHGETGARGIDDIFADDDDEDEIDTRRRDFNEFDDFIEDDEGPDLEADLEDLEVSRRPKKGLAGLTSFQASGLDEADAEDMRAAFGDGTEYDWALQLQEELEDDHSDHGETIELKDVFEPSQLAERLLTDADNVIRQTDIPERFQIARQPFTEPQLSPEDAAARAYEESVWISNMIWPKKRFEPSLYEPFRKAIAKCLEFMNVDNFEVPFIFQHRKDHLIHAQRLDDSFDLDNGAKERNNFRAEKLLGQNDLWEIHELDLKFRAFAEKKDGLRRTYSNLQTLSISDDIVESSLSSAVTMDDLQDIQDYVHFQYSAQLKDLVAMTASELNSVQKRARAANTIFEKLRAARAYNIVRGFGISADAFAQNALEPNQRAYTDDPPDRPDDMGDQNTDEDYPDGPSALKAAKSLFAEEIFMSPKMRKLMRQTWFTRSHFDCIRTDKGLRKIDEDHPYYEFKYLRNQTLQSVARRPELYLRMLAAEQDGLVEVLVRLDNEQSFRKSLVKALESDNFSEIADAWNTTRREVLDVALARLEKMMTRSVKEHIKTECEAQLARACREEYSKKLDQAPYKPRDEKLGTEPRVLAISNGAGASNRDAIVWAWVEDGGRCLEWGKFTDLRIGQPERGIADGADIKTFRELVERRVPDVIAVSGFSAYTRTLYKDIQTIVDTHELKGPVFTDDETGAEKQEKVDLVMVNDEVARLYHTSDRSNTDYPGFSALTKYCIALARYCQNPLKEYVSLGRDITSVTFLPHQGLIPQEKLLKHLETAMVDMVNLVGVDINEAINDNSVANLMTYVCGLGPRKVAAVRHAINRNGGHCNSRAELVGDPDNDKMQAVGPKVWENCASFLILPWEENNSESDYLDGTRIHPSDYDLARKMAADGLELDEEDVKAEVDEFGPSAVIRRLRNEEKQESVNELVLESYAEQLERDFHDKKRATLETIRAELQEPYEELRRNFGILSSDEIFTMLTGETRESLTEGMIIPVSIKKSFMDHIEVRLDCGIEGTVPESEFPSGLGVNGMEVRQAFLPHQTVQARVLFLDRKRMAATLSMRDDQIRRGYKKEIDRIPGEWDEMLEASDRRDATKRKEDVTGRAQRVIKHPLFRPFNATQAEEYLGPLNRGDCVIRPSSKGLDHLAVTWKVADNVFQHIDVLELDKENEFSVGRVLKIGGKYTYSDLDELIVNYVKAMAKKVDEIMRDDRYQEGGKVQTEQWLKSYMDANPKRSMYAFCINREYPGYFLLCFKANQKGKSSSWPVKIIPNAFQLQRNDYPSMLALKNGFKVLIKQQQEQQENQHQHQHVPNGRRAY